MLAIYFLILSPYVKIFDQDKFSEASTSSNFILVANFNSSLLARRSHFREPLVKNAKNEGAQETALLRRAEGVVHRKRGRHARTIYFTRGPYAPYTRGMVTWCESEREYINFAPSSFAESDERKKRSTRASPRLRIINVAPMFFLHAPRLMTRTRVGSGWVGGWVEGAARRWRLLLLAAPAYFLPSLSLSTELRTYFLFAGGCLLFCMLLLPLLELCWKTRERLARRICTVALNWNRIPLFSLLAHVSNTFYKLFWGMK